MKSKTVAEINKKIGQGKAVVMTAHQLCEMVRGGKSVTLDDVDVVTSATCGLMSGTAAILSFPVCGRGVFRKAEMLWLNGVPALPGPAPNERLGEIDTIVYGTAKSVDNPRYGGGHLFRNIVEGKEIQVRVKTTEGRTLESCVTMKDMTYARILAMRNAFKNYTAFVNIHKNPVRTIFHVSAMQGHYKELSFCGCGEINPVEKDPLLRTIGVGTRCLINGATGYVTGSGTRSTPEKPNLSGFADMRKMKPKYMGGFSTSAGPEVIGTWAVPIPILDEDILKSAKRIDERTRLPVADIRDRIPFSVSDYGRVWQGVDLNIKFDRKTCGKSGKDCREKGNKCVVESVCPTGAFSYSRLSIDKTLCFNCGACVNLCLHHAFMGKLGSVEIRGREVPVTIRQSNRLRAQEIAMELKKRIESGSFLLSAPLENISFGKKDSIPCRQCDRSYCTGSEST